ncbi:MAG: hypothetical protein M3367_16425 [Acidobacteriota bacterium]|nr:hypothetical protein [Acidobacteriota bacterium]
MLIAPARGNLTLQIPAAMQISGDAATLYAPGLASPKKLPMTRKDNRVVITIPDAPIYSVIAIE